MESTGIIKEICELVLFSFSQIQYLESASQKARANKSEYLRELIEKDRKKIIF
jgi:hypothetical protein